MDLTLRVETNIDTGRAEGEPVSNLISEMNSLANLKWISYTFSNTCFKSLLKYALNHSLTDMNMVNSLLEFYHNGEF